MVSLKTSLLPLLLLLRTTFANNNNEDDAPTSPCIWICLSNHAPGINTFTCQYLTTNTALVSCINACPDRDINNYLIQVLKLDSKCERTLFHTRTSDDYTHTITGGPIATATDDNSGHRPTGSSDNTQSDDKGGDRTKTDHGRHGGHNSDDSSDDHMATRTESNTVATDQATVTTTGIVTVTTSGIVTTTTSGSGNATRTTTTAPAGNTGAAAAGFGVPGVGAVLMGVAAWAWVL